MFAVAFDLDGTLARSTGPADAVALGFVADIGLDPPRSAAAQELEPAPGALRVVRELEALGVPLAALAAGPAEDARRRAELVWFRGPVVTGEFPGGVPEAAAFAEICARFGLPAECVWYVTARSEADARAAWAAGLQAVLVDPAAPEPAPDDRGLRRAKTLEGVLELLRA
ncbi:MAG TPA: HAD family hydrolase, partial [Candidatus Elarobacter sp.]